MSGKRDTVNASASIPPFIPLSPNIDAIPDSSFPLFFPDSGAKVTSTLYIGGRLKAIIKPNIALTPATFINCFRASHNFLTYTIKSISGALDIISFFSSLILFQYISNRRRC